MESSGKDIWRRVSHENSDCACLRSFQLKPGFNKMVPITANSAMQARRSIRKHWNTNMVPITANSAQLVRRSIRKHWNTTEMIANAWALLRARKFPLPERNSKFYAKENSKFTSPQMFTTEVDELYKLRLWFPYDLPNHPNRSEQCSSVCDHPGSVSLLSPCFQWSAGRS